MGGLDRWARSQALRAVADQLDAAADELVPIGVRETHLGEPRLRGELRRTTFQLRLFADVVDDGAYLDIRIDHADSDWPMGAPRPDLRRILHPLGPVLVFAASNFPFAFSVAGGDTASALAAGCPVVVKAHPGHPELGSDRRGRPAGPGRRRGTGWRVRPHLRDRRRGGGAAGTADQGGLVHRIHRRRPGVVRHREPAARAHPFYGELGSVNPVFVTERAAESRPDQIVSEFVASFTLGAGQFCTKPGVLLVPRDSAVVERLAEAELPGPAPLLYPRIQEGYVESLRRLAAEPAVSVPRSGDPYADPPSPTLLTTAAADLLADLREGRDEVFRECFGPTTLVASYDNDDELLAVAEAIDGQLTASIIGTDDDPVVAPLRDALALKAGRVLWNGWPTGVSVTYAQQHGGPYPATTAPTTTSVGTAAIARFLRPVAYQGFPQHLLPAAVRDDTDLPRLVDGRR